jgi:hypothetical protein
MKGVLDELHWRKLLADGRKIGWGSYAAIAILLGLLICVIVIAEMGWSSAAGTDVPIDGYIAMAIGVTFSLIVGIGLMALVFYSSRAGYDEPARVVRSETDQKE